MKIVTYLAVLGGLLLGGCGQKTLGTYIGARELQPPQTGIYVGGLYAPIADERKSAKGPLSVRLVCSVSPTLAELGVPAPKKDPEAIAQIDLVTTVLGGGGLKALNKILTTAGLDGSFSQYYDYKIVNGKKYYIDGEAADQAFAALMRRSTCRRAFETRVASKPIYQVMEVYVGDIVFQRKREFALGGEVAAKLRAVEPSLKATLKDTLQLGVSGSGLVFGIGTEPRLSSAPGG